MKVVFRCDGGTCAGTGHLMRCLALAEETAARGGRAILAVHEPPSWLSWPEVVAVKRPGDPDEVLALDPDAAVVDGYHFAPDYYARLREAGVRTAAIDDLGGQPFAVDLVVNPNAHAPALRYDAPGARLLLGPAYALLRAQFREARRAQAAPPVPERVRRVLITMGGGDASNETGKALRALALAGWRGRVDVVVGPANPHIGSLLALAYQSPCRVKLHVAPDRMAPLITRTHLCFSAAGGTSWELACLGVPAVQIVVADNQRPSAERLHAMGVVALAGDREHVDESRLASLFLELDADREERLAMSGRARRLVDGEGVRRVADALLEAACPS